MLNESLFLKNKVVLDIKNKKVNDLPTVDYKKYIFYSIINSVGSVIVIDKTSCPDSNFVHRFQLIPWTSQKITSACILNLH